MNGWSEWEGEQPHHSPISSPRPQGPSLVFLLLFSLFPPKPQFSGHRCVDFQSTFHFIGHNLRPPFTARFPSLSLLIISLISRSP